MNWIDERASELMARQERKRKIASAMYRIFDTLWEQIKKDIKYATEQHGIPSGIPMLNTEGDLAHREMTIWTPATNQRKEAHLKLDTEKHRIDYSCGSLRTAFPVAVLDGEVCLKDKDGNKIELIDAARAILDPMLFPELQKPDTSQ